MQNLIIEIQSQCIFDSIFCSEMKLKVCISASEVREVRTKLISNLSLYSCNELAGSISASLRPGNTVSFEEMSQRGEPLATLCPI